MSWEERMAERARVRAEERNIIERVRQREVADEAYEAAKARPWLNGWPRIAVNRVMIGGGTHCICCGRNWGVTCFVPSPEEMDPDYVSPPTPQWPFTEADCPLCTG